MSAKPAALQELARRTLARRRLLEFVRQTHATYTPGWVHEDVCKRLERFSLDVIERRSPRLMLLMPPRHGKSELASIRFSAWHLGHAPSHEIINVGYNLDLPMKFSRKVRELVRDPFYQAIFPDTQLDPESQSVEAWITLKGGGFTAAGRGGGITGKGAHILTVDDPLKNQEEADSAATRDALWDWYLSTAYTRLAPGGGVLVIQTWWNDDDLAGRIQSAMVNNSEADQFDVVKYPALAEAHEYRDETTLKVHRYQDEELCLVDPSYTKLRAKGEALHRERYDEVALRRIRAVQEPRIWSALYQQNPVPDEGMYFKKEYFRMVPAAPEPYNAHIYTAWDFAIGQKQTNDWTVGATVIQDSSDTLFPVEINRLRGDSFLLVETILDVANRWADHFGSQYSVGFEDGQIWKSIEPLLRRRAQERRIYLSYTVLKPLTDKLARARPLQGRMQQGRVAWPQTLSNFAEVQAELLRFPAGTHDDIVDALAWVTRMTLDKPIPASSDSRVVQLKSWRDKLAGRGLYEGSHMCA